MLLNDSYPPRRLGYTDNEHLGFTGRLDTALQLAPSPRLATSRPEYRAPPYTQTHVATASAPSCPASAH